MESLIWVTRLATRDIVAIPALYLSQEHLVTVTYLSQRFAIDPRFIRSVSERGSEPIHPQIVVSTSVKGLPHWSLKVGSMYLLNSDLSIESLEDTSDIVPALNSPILINEDPVEVLGILYWKGASEISKFVSHFILSSGEIASIEFLPKSYNVQRYYFWTPSCAFSAKEGIRVQVHGSWQWLLPLDATGCYFGKCKRFLLVCKGPVLWIDFISEMTSAQTLNRVGSIIRPPSQVIQKGTGCLRLANKSWMEDYCAFTVGCLQVVLKVVPHKCFTCIQFPPLIERNWNTCHNPCWISCPLSS